MTLPLTHHLDTASACLAEAGRSLRCRDLTRATILLVHAQEHTNKCILQVAEALQRPRIINFNEAKQLVREQEGTSG